MRALLTLLWFLLFRHRNNLTDTNQCSWRCTSLAVAANRHWPLQQCMSMMVVGLVAVARARMSPVFTSNSGETEMKMSLGIITNGKSANRMTATQCIEVSSLRENYSVKFSQSVRMLNKVISMKLQAFSTRPPLTRTVLLRSGQISFSTSTRFSHLLQG